MKHKRISSHWTIRTTKIWNKKPDYIYIHKTSVDLPLSKTSLLTKNKWLLSKIMLPKHYGQQHWKHHCQNQICRRYHWRRTSFIPCFSNIITEASLTETLSDNILTDGKTITTLYDEGFIDAVSYQVFTENKLQLWENTMEYKYFDTMYTNHRSLVNTIWKIHQQAQQLLEEADILTGRDYILQQEIKSHVSKITRTKLWQRLYKPTLLFQRHTASSLLSSKHVVFPNWSHLTCCIQFSASNCLPNTSSPIHSNRGANEVLWVQQPLSY